MTTTTRPRYSPRQRLLQAAGLVTAALLAAGVLSATAPTAAVAAEEDSSVTVKWAGGNSSELQQYQVDHTGLLSDGTGKDKGSGHWDDFKNLEVTVSKTTGLRDGAVNVTASGMAPTKNDGWAGSASNYLQLMQCWGPDPLAVDFAETCQFGGWDGGTTGGVVSAAQIGQVINRDTYTRGGWSAQGALPFRSVGDVKSVPYEFTIPGGAGSTISLNGLAPFFDANTSNEVPYAAIAGDGRSSVSFTTQSAAAAPHLGCGNPASAAKQRCWLVVVPRGEHTGAFPGIDRGCLSAGASVTAYGLVSPFQAGSPVSPACSFFANRMVIPLDFADTTAGCPAGTAERRIVGSDLVTQAVGAWQPALCTAAGGAVFSLSTNSGDVNRSQLVTGQAGLALVNTPVSAETIGLTSPELLESTSIQYGPVANAALAFGFVMTKKDGVTPYTDVKLTPRLLAKLMTLSYRFDKPNITGMLDDVESESIAASVAQDVSEDAEWIALGNPTDFMERMPAFVVSGPQGDDAIGALWDYIQSDADAAAFLAGEPDPWGKVVNPYYLPAGHPRAAGGGLPFDLAEASVDSFIRADQSLTPSVETAAARFRGERLDVLAANPYSTGLTANAERIHRVDTRRVNEWDPNRAAGPTLIGTFAPLPPASPQFERFILGPTTASSSIDFHLDTASLALPLTEKTGKDTVASARAFVAPTAESMARSVSSASIDPQTGFASIDPAAVGAGAYPLTMTVNAAANLASTKLDAAARTQYAQFVRYAATDGNITGTGIGQLPEGFVPLTAAQSAASLAFADALVAPPAVAVAVLPAAPAAPSAAVKTVTAPESSAMTQVQTAGTAEALASADTELTASASQGALGLILLVGIGGLAAAPFLLRRKTAGA